MGRSGPQIIYVTVLCGNPHTKKNNSIHLDIQRKYTKITHTDIQTNT